MQASCLQQNLVHGKYPNDLRPLREVCWLRARRPGSLILTQAREIQQFLNLASEGVFPWRAGAPDVSPNLCSEGKLAASTSSTKIATRDARLRSTPHADDHQSAIPKSQLTKIVKPEFVCETETKVLEATKFQHSSFTATAPGVCDPSKPWLHESTQFPCKTCQD